MGLIEKLKFMMTSLVICFVVGTLIFGVWCGLTTLSAGQLIWLAGMCEAAGLLILAFIVSWWCYNCNCSIKELILVSAGFVGIVTIFAAMSILPSWLIGFGWLENLGFSAELAQCSDSLILHAFIGGIFWLLVAFLVVVMFLLYIDCVWEDIIKNTIFLLFCLGSIAATIYVENMFVQIV